MSALALPADPFFAAGSAFLFPDRDGLFDAIDHHPARREGLGTMRRCGHDRDRRIADYELAEAMDNIDCNVAVRETYVVDDLANFLLRHRPIRVVVNRLH